MTSSINGHIRWETDNILIFQGQKLSDPVKVGRCEWSLKASILEVENLKNLKIELICSEPVKTVQKEFLLVNQTEYGKIFLNKESPNLVIKWSKLVSEGFVKNGKIIVECKFRIDKGKVRNIDFHYPRPNEQDLRMILEKRKYPSKLAKIEEEVKLSEITAKGYWNDRLTVLGLPSKLEIKKIGNWIWLKLHLNWKDKSVWWRCRVTVDFRINSTISESGIWMCHASDHICSYSQKWEDLVDFEKLNIQVIVRMLESYGFDENPKNGRICQSIRKMTDITLKVGQIRLAVAGKILAQNSVYFRDLLSSGNSEFEINDVDSEDFIRFLELLHNVDTEVSDGVLKIIDRFGVSGNFQEAGSQNFKEKTDLTDVEIELDGRNFYASKQILANSSYYYMKRFYGPYSKDSENTISAYSVTPEHFELLLTHIYSPKSPVTSANLDSLLQLSHQFSVPRLMDKCEEYLVLNDSVSLIDKLEYCGKFDLPYLLESCLEDAEKMREVKEDPKFRKLPSNVIKKFEKRYTSILEHSGSF